MTSPVRAARYPVLAAAVMAVMGCNAYSDALPPARCQAPEHCLPGEGCDKGVCKAHGVAVLEVAGPVRSVRAMIVTAPRSVLDVARSPHARLVGKKGPVPLPEGKAATLRFDGLPVLPTYAILWDGAAERPCKDTVAMIAPISDGGGHSRLYLHTRWDGPCLRTPRPLHHSDRLAFKALGHWPTAP
jgi:hypothetical protein